MINDLVYEYRQHRLDFTTQLPAREYLDKEYNDFYDIFIDTVGAESLKNGSLKKVFDKHFSSVQFNNNLNNRIISYCQSVFNRDGNVEWFGSNLLGTETIRFYTTDRDRFFDDVLVIDEDYLNDSISSETDVNMSWKVTSDTFNLSIVYMLHRYFQFIDKDKKAKEAAVELVKLLQFKFYSSIYSNFFSKPVDPGAAEGAYSALSLKFAIKQQGSWGALIEDRAEYFVSKESPHYKKVKAFNSTPEIIYFLSDLNTRTKQTVKDYYGVLDKVRSEGLRINTDSSMVILDGESILKDRTTSYNNARVSLLDASTTYQNFYKAEYVDIVLELVPKTSPQALRDFIKYISTLPFGKERDAVEKIMEDTLMYVFDYIISNRFNFNNSKMLLLKVQRLIQAPKSNDPRVLGLRDRLEKLGKAKTHVTHPAALSALRTSVILYFVLFAIVGGKNN